MKNDKPGYYSYEMQYTVVPLYSLHSNVIMCIWPTIFSHSAAAQSVSAIAQKSKCGHCKFDYKGLGTILAIEYH